MNETIKTLLSRRSIRKFTDAPISDEDISLILEAGKFAPTGGNSQSPIFIVVQKPEMVKKLSAMNAAVMGKEGIDPFYGAPMVIVVLADKSKMTYLEDGALAMGNMYNAAFSLGLGCCWIHRAKQMFESEEGKALLSELGIEGEYQGIGNLILGHYDCELPTAAPRKENSVYYIK